MAPQRCSILNPSIYEYVIFRGKRDFAEKYLDHPSGSNLITWILKTGKPIIGGQREGEVKIQKGGQKIGER